MTNDRRRVYAIHVAISIAIVAGCNPGGIRPRSEDAEVAIDAGVTPAGDAGALDAYAGSDAGPLDGNVANDAGASDAGLTLALAVQHAEGACGDLALAHPAPAFMVRFEASGPPSTTVSLWADKPACGVAPFLYRELALDATGRARFDLPNPGSSACDDTLLGGWRVWLELGAERSNVEDVIVRSTACTGATSCDAASAFCPVTAAPIVDELARRDGAFFTPDAAAPMLHVDTEGRGTAYDRIEIEFDVVVGDWQPEIPDEGNPDRTEHILFGLFRANQPRTNYRYLMGAAAVTWPSRTPHLRMFGRNRITDEGYITYVQSSASFGWERGQRYHLRCTLDGVADEQRCELARAGTIEATRTLAVAYLDPAMHLASGFYVEIGQTPDEWGIETSPMGWVFSDLVVRGVR